MYSVKGGIVGYGYPTETGTAGRMRPCRDQKRRFLRLPDHQGSETVSRAVRIDPLYHPQAPREREDADGPQRGT